MLNKNLNNYSYEKEDIYRASAGLCDSSLRRRPYRIWFSLCWSKMERPLPEYLWLAVAYSAVCAFRTSFYPYNL